MGMAATSGTLAGACEPAQGRAFLIRPYYTELFYKFANMEWQEYIVADKEILLGKPVIKGTRLSVELILDLLSSGWTEQMLYDSYPKLTEQQLKAVFAYLKDCIQHEFFFTLDQSV